MNFSGIAVDTQIGQLGGIVEAQNLKGQIESCYTFDPIEETEFGRTFEAQVSNPQLAVLYKVETTNHHTIEVTENCEFLILQDGDLKWCRLFDVPVDAKFVTLAGSYRGTILSKREGLAVHISVEGNNTIIANGFNVSC